MTQLLTEATVLDLHIELNTYVKMLSALYFDYTLKLDRATLIQHLFTLFNNDHC